MEASKEALELLGNLISKPLERAAYKRDPDAYLSSQDIDEEARRQVLDVLSLGVIMEVHTVAKLTVPSSSNNKDDFDVISLEKVTVRLTSKENFLIERNVKGSAQLLPHSHVHIDNDVKVFSLNLCYTDLEDTT